MVSGLAPGKPAPTDIVGKSTCGKGATGKKGKADVTLVNTRVTLDSGPHSVFTNGGTALMIHAQKDDMHTDPTGAAGARIACGTITK